MPGFAHYTVDIVSPELPCGAAWIGNLLLELDIPIWHPWGADMREEWRWLGSNRFRHERADEGWSRLLSALVHAREFEFRAAPVPRLGHHWPGHFPRLPAILVVRDPRDALYSAWRREQALNSLDASVDFISFLTSKFRHAPATWASYFAVHVYHWQAQIAKAGGLVLRFEDFKRDPLAQAIRVLQFLQIEVCSTRLLAALDASTHARLVHAERRLLAAGVVPSALLGGGVVDEWRSHFTVQMHAAIPEWIWAIFEPLGYVPAHPGASAPRPSRAQVSELLQFFEVPATE